MTQNNLIYLLKILGLTLLLVYIVDKILFLGLSKFSDRVFTGQGIGKLNHYLSIKDSADILIYGSSRANRHFLADSLSTRAYNIGVDGRKMAYPTALVHLLETDRRQLVIFHVDIAYLVDKTYNGEDVDALKSKYHRNLTIKKYVDRYRQTVPFQDMLWSIDYNGYVVGIVYNFLFPKYDYRRYQGYDPNFVSQEQQHNLQRLINRSRVQDCSEDLEINEVSKVCMKEVADFCEKYNKQLIFVTSPEYEDTCKDDNAIVEHYMRGQGYIYLDYSDFFKGRNKPIYWKDLYHMSDEGAKKFTQQFKADIVSCF